MTALPPPSGPHPGSGADDLPLVERAIPVAHALLWEPVGAESGPPDPGHYPVYITRRAVQAVNAHAPPSTDVGVFGFLAGDLCHCPHTGDIYLAVDLLIGLPQPIHGDKAAALMSSLLPNVQRRLADLRRHLLGWYHSHPPLGLMMTPADVEAHFRHFAHPWQVALVVNQGEYGPEAGFYRPIPDAGIPAVPLPFYEVIDPRARAADGRLRSFVHWDNYQAHRKGAAAGRAPGPAPAADVPAAAAPPPAPAPAPLVPVDEASPLDADVSSLPLAGDDDVPPTVPARVERRSPERVLREIGGVDEAPWRPPPVVARRSRARLVAAFAGVAVVAFALGALLGPRPTSVLVVPGTTVPPDTIPAVTAAPAAEVLPTPERPQSPLANPLAALSDSLRDALQRYQSRAAQFGSQRTDCQSLAEGLVTAERLWLAYSVQRKKLGRRLDPARATADTAFYSATDSVEASYERSRCPRP